MTDYDPRENARRAVENDPLSDPRPDLGELLDAVELFIRRYVVLDESQATAAALWVPHTWAMEAAQATPYLFVNSAEPECGKTRLLEVLHELVRAPVPIIPLLDAELRAHRARQAEHGFQRVKPEALVFPTRTGRPQDRRDVLRAVYVAGDAAGLNPERVERVGCHDLRHSAAGLLLAAGASMPKVAAILRHSDTRVTAETYAGLVESERAALADDLEAAFGGTL